MKKYSIRQKKQLKSWPQLGVNETPHPTKKMLNPSYKKRFPFFILEKNSFFFDKKIYFQIYPNKIFQPKFINFLLEIGIQMNLLKDSIHNRSLF